METRILGIKKRFGKVMMWVWVKDAQFKVRTFDANLTKRVKWDDQKLEQ